MSSEFQKWVQVESSYDPRVLTYIHISERLVKFCEDWCKEEAVGTIHRNGRSKNANDLLQALKEFINGNSAKEG